MNEDRQIIVNQIRTPDGTVIQSRYVHDYVTHKDKNGQFYAVDGGTYYLKRAYDVDDYEEISLYSDSPFEELREAIYRGGRGKDGKQPLTYVKLSEMSTSWVQATVEYETERRPNNKFLPYYIKELEYRADNNIFIED